MTTFYRITTYFYNVNSKYRSFLLAILEHIGDHLGVNILYTI